MSSLRLWSGPSATISQMYEANICRAEHLQDFLNQDVKPTFQLVRHYVKALKMLYGRSALVAQTSEPKTTEAGRSASSLTSIAATYLCLQCSSICDKHEQAKHAKLRDHYFCRPFSTRPSVPPTDRFQAVESRSGCLFCHKCQDYVYDPSLEDLRTQRNSETAYPRKKCFSRLHRPWLI